MPNCLSVKIGMLVSLKVLTIGLIIQTAAAQDSAKMVLLADIILLVVEGGVLIPLAFLYMYWVIRNITIERVNLYSIFLRLPRPTVVAISKAEVRLVGEDGFDDDDEPAVSTTKLVLHDVRGCSSQKGGGAESCDSSRQCCVLSLLALQLQLVLDQHIFSLHACMHAEAATLIL